MTAHHPMKVTVRRYKNKRSGTSCWEYKIMYKCPFSGKIKVKRRTGYHSKVEAELAACEMSGYIAQIYYI